MPQLLYVLHNHHVAVLLKTLRVVNSLFRLLESDWSICNFLRTAEALPSQTLGFII